MKNVRNFCIIAHIDHGKSTLADRMLELTGAVARVNTAQVLDSMDLERERGITIKSSPVRLRYRSRKGKDIVLNLIDTPGHVDFNYEVSRSLKACEGVVLLVDATQGVEAQTIANTYLAMEAGLTIIPVLNKIDLPNAMIEDCLIEIEEMLALPAEEVLCVSAKDGTGVEDLLEALVEIIPPPGGISRKPLQCLVFDSHYDTYRGVIVHLRIFSGSVAKGDKIQFKSTEKSFEVEEVGFFLPHLTRCARLFSGEVGYLMAVVRDPKNVQVGDTIISANHLKTPGIKGFRRSQPMVFCGLYPVDTTDYEKLNKALGKFQLNDSSVDFEKESSAALGHGFRAGFLGTLHMDIAMERLRREHDIELIATMPSVAYKVVTKQGDELILDNPSQFPPQKDIDHIEEPIVRARIVVLHEYVGSCMKLSMERRGVLIGTEYPEARCTILNYEYPLSEIIVDYYDRLKSISRGHASLDYEFIGFRTANLAKVDILINGDPVDALSFISERTRAEGKGRALIKKLRELIPRQQFKVPLQAAVGPKIIAREDIQASRKDVIAKCYGGDITRKRKLLERQREGKKKMKLVGSVEVPQEAFLALLKIDE